jgi:hypothetical protein
MSFISFVGSEVMGGTHKRVRASERPGPITSEEAKIVRADYARLHAAAASQKFSEENGMIRATIHLTRRTWHRLTFVSSVM